jgi:hypothetical protein
MRWTALACALVAVLTATKGHLVLRLTRNLFTPGVPRAIEPRYPLVLDETLARDITVVVGTKDSVTPTQTQLAHLATALPLGVRVIYTYPEPLFEEAEAYADKLRAAAGPLAKRLKLLPVSTFANPFAAWLKAAPFIKTKYTLLMHNDVFLLDDRGHFLSELHGALETEPDITVAAPQIYETEFEGLLTTHLFNTNLHLRLHPTTGVAMMSHEVDLVTGTSREPGDFAQRMNRNFLEDHVFLVRSEHVDGTFIDPDAARSPPLPLEYSPPMSMSMSMSMWIYTLPLPPVRTQWLHHAHLGPAPPPHSPPNPAPLRPAPPRPAPPRPAPLRPAPPRPAPLPSPPLPPSGGRRARRPPPSPVRARPSHSSTSTCS